MNGFEKHGLKHTSASQLNMWIAAPDAWVARYLFDKRFKFGVAAQVGVLVENVVQEVLLGGTLDHALDKAVKQFNKDNALNTSEKDLERVNHIEPMAVLALDELKPYGEPEFKKTINGVEQQRVELLCNGMGWQLPIIGYCDFVYPKHSLIVDLKTTLRMPSVMSLSHKRQGAIYARAKDMDVKFLYVTPKKSKMIDVTQDDIEQSLKSIKDNLSRQEKLLKFFDAETVKEIIPLTEDSFYWSGSEDVKKELYG